MTFSFLICPRSLLTFVYKDVCSKSTGASRNARFKFGARGKFKWFVSITEDWIRPCNADCQTKTSKSNANIIHIISIKTANDREAKLRDWVVALFALKALSMKWYLVTRVLVSAVFAIASYVQYKCHPFIEYLERWVLVGLSVRDSNRVRISWSLCPRFYGKLIHGNEGIQGRRPLLN